jgi:SpoVK/Ycf46/Vps4 family AAA+-type ATPase
MEVSTRKGLVAGKMELTVHSALHTYYYVCVSPPPSHAHAPAGVDLEKIARATSGFTGADLANLVNQAALKACVDEKDSVTYEDLDYAM